MVLTYTVLGIVAYCGALYFLGKAIGFNKGK